MGVIGSQKIDQATPSKVTNQNLMSISSHKLRHTFNLHTCIFLQQSIGQAACRPLRDTLRNISAGYVPIPTKVFDHTHVFLFKVSLKLIQRHVIPQGDPYEERPSEKKTGNEAKLGKKVSRDESFVLESKDSPSQQDDSPIHQNHVADFELLESDEQAL